jgi:gamma-glutamyltranspeptidase/glutathione hydrolase
MAATGHYLATTAALRMLERGGNAFDAGVAAGLATNVLQPDMTSIGGVAPIMLYSARDRRVFTISGLGHWPEQVDRSYFIAQSGGRIPPGVRRCVLPAAMDAWLTTLERWGSLTFREVVAPAIELARDGFAIYPFLHESLVDAADDLRRWSASAMEFLADGDVPAVGSRLRQSALAATLESLGDTERAAGGSREDGVRAAREAFYKGDIAEKIAAFMHDEGGWMTYDDLSTFQVEIDEQPPHVSYRGYDVFGCGPWCQGPVALETLAILEGYDMRALGQNSPDALHIVIEALKAAFADREQFVGDPRFIEVPLAGLLHPGYAETWRERLSLHQASPGMPEPGNPWPYVGAHRDVSAPRPAVFAAPVEPDTSYLCVVDERGNAFSATPSDGFGGTPLVPGLGFIVSGRGTQSRLDPDHPASLAPGKRPRLTPNPGIIMRDGELFAPFGTPGNDTQPQAMVQFIVNLIDHGMNPQEAVEAPRVATYSFPRSSHPHPYTPGLAFAESRLPATTVAELRRRGHDVRAWSELAAPAGSLCSIVVDRPSRFLIGAADPRRLAYAAGW